MLRFIFSSKSIDFVFLFLIGSDGLSMFFSVPPSFSSAVPCVLILTPPGPKIFSAGPRSKCMSENENLSSPLFATSSAFFSLKNRLMARFPLQARYSSGVISIGVLRYESPIFEPMKYIPVESSYSAA